MAKIISRFTAVTFREVGADLFEVAKRGQALGRVKLNRDSIPNTWDAYNLQGMRIGRYFKDADNAAVEVADWLGLSLTAMPPWPGVGTNRITGRVYPPALASA